MSEKDNIEYITWIKPSGVEAKTNSEPATIKKCEELKWERKKGRPTKD